MVKALFKKRSLILVIAILAVAAFCIFLVVDMIANIGAGIEETLASYAGDVSTDIERNIKDEFQTLDIEMEQAGIDDVESFDDLYSFLEGISTPGQDFILLAVNDGYFQSAEQTAYIKPVPIEYFEDKYAILKVYDNYTSSEKVALIMPLNALTSIEDFSEYYIALIVTEEKFADIVLDGVLPDDEYTVVFSEWGDPVSYRPYAGNRGRAAMDELMLKEAQSYYPSGEKTIVKRVSSSTYDYIILTDYVRPTGYFLGIYVNALQVVPIVNNLMHLVIVIGGLVVIMILLAVLFRRNTKDSIKGAVMTDPLTGTLNQASMQEKVDGYLKKNYGRPCSLVCIDIMAFHNFNAMFGYAQGDELLRLVGKMLTKQYPLAFRLSNDVFAFLLPKEHFDIGGLDHELFREIEQTIGITCAEAVSIKAGVVPIDTKNRDASRELVEKALFAVKEAKKRSEQSTVVYDRILEDAAALKKNVEVNMIHALSKGEFEVYIQPKINMDDQSLCGGEALVRWQSGQMGFVQPDQFISIFETNGFIVEIDFFMLTSVLKMLQERIDQGKFIVPISVNQSKVTITYPNYLDRLKNTMSAFSVPAEYIEIEITESSFEQDNELLISLVDSIKELGFPVDMDDFGSGYSSLNILRRLPIDIIKIDRGFLGEADTSHQSRMIIRSIIQMSHGLGISVVCEGVETEPQFNFLKEAGCDSMQGYLFSKPIPMDQFVNRYLDGKDNE